MQLTSPLPALYFEKSSYIPKIASEFGFKKIELYPIKMRH